MSPFHRLQGALLRLVHVLVTLPPLGWSLRFAGWVGWLGYWVDGRHRRIVHINLDLAYGEAWTARQKRRCARAAFVNFAMTIVEGMYFSRGMSSRSVRRVLEFVGATQKLQEAAARGPLLLLSGHLGNWELLMAGLRELQIPMVGVMRPIKNPAVHEWLVSLRLQLGQELAQKKGALRDLRRALDRNRSVGLLIDQHDRNGVVVDFFGRPTTAHPAAAVLALRYQLPVYMGYVERVTPGKKYRFVVVGPIQTGGYGQPRPDAGGDRADRDPHALLKTAQRFTRIFEGFVRQRPEQWFWLHRRWKHVPDQLDPYARAAAPQGKHSSAATDASDLASP